MRSERNIDLLAVGETMGLFVADRSERLQPGMPLHFSFGGAESNAAIAAARLGLAVAWASRLGDDAVGGAIRRSLTAESIEVIAEVDPVRRTGMMLKERLSPLRQRVTYYREGSAASVLRHSVIDDALLGQTRMLLVSGVTCALSPDMPREIEQLFDRARNAGTRVALDLNYRSTLWSREAAGRVYRKLAPLVDVLFAGVDEASIIANDADDLNSALSALSVFDCPLVVVTDGAGGSLARAGGAEVYADALAVPVVDTVGAGDAFVGAFLSDWLRNLTLEECMRTASAAGAHACMFAGDWEGAPTREDIDSLSEGAVVER